MIANNIMKNWDGKQPVDQFIKQASFFEQAVVREQIFRLYSIKLQIKAELD